MRRCLEDDGNVFVEYVVILAGVSVAVALALVAAGPALLAFSTMQRSWIALPFP